MNDTVLAILGLASVPVALGIALFIKTRPGKGVER